MQKNWGSPKRANLGTAEPEARGNWKMISVVLMKFVRSWKFGKGGEQGLETEEIWGIIYVGVVASTPGGRRWGQGSRVTVHQEP